MSFVTLMDHDEGCLWGWLELVAGELQTLYLPELDQETAEGV